MEAGRLNAYKVAPDAMRAVQQVEAYIQRCGLEKSLIELVKMRASQISSSLNICLSNALLHDIYHVIRIDGLHQPIMFQHPPAGAFRISSRSSQMFSHRSLLPNRQLSSHHRRATANL
jgi:hypothetical protein